LSLRHGHVVIAHALIMFYYDIRTYWELARFAAITPPKWTFGELGFPERKSELSGKPVWQSIIIVI